MPRKGGRRKKTRTHKEEIPEGANVPEALEENVPRSIVARITKVSPPVGELVRDLRALMGPYTASNLKEKRFNRTKDFISIAGHLGVSHLLFVSQTESNVNLRMARHPNGPTLHFRVNQFMLPKQIKAMQKRPFESHAAFQTPPVLVLNNFNQSDEQHVKLMKVTFQHLFPAINVKTVKLSDCRRVVLFNFNKDSQTVDMRHYAIRANPVGISRSVKRIIQAKVPDLGSLKDISEFIDGSYAAGAASDSEMEDESSRVTLPERFLGRGNAKSQLSAMKLTELGPRLSLELYKVEQGVGEGDVLYHKFVQKSAEEAAATKARVEREKKLKEQRRKIQEENVKRKRDALEEKKRLKAERKRQRLENGEAAEESSEDEEEDDEEGDAEYDEDYDGVEGEYEEEEENAEQSENEGEEEEDDDEDEDDEEEEEE